MKVVAPMGAKEAYISNEGPTEAKPIVISNGGGEANSSNTATIGGGGESAMRKTSDERKNKVSAKA